MTASLAPFLIMLKCYKLCKILQKNYTEKHISNQLIRASTSIGANYEEARGSESNADFAHKIGVTLKEARETLYWLRIISESELIQPKKLENLIIETNEICAILTTTAKTMKNKLAKT